MPCLNEAENVETLVSTVVSELGGRCQLEILLIDDGSTDDTLDEIKRARLAHPCVSYLSFTRNFGLESAFSAGFLYAAHDWVLQLDADLQFPPGEAHSLLDTAAEGYDAVFGIRTDRRDGVIRRTASHVADLVGRRLLAIEMPRGASSFRLIRSDLAKRAVELGLPTPYFLATVPRLTRAWTTAPVAHQPRRAGQPKVTIVGLARHLMGLFIAFSRRVPAAAGALLLIGALVLVSDLVAVAVWGVSRWTLLPLVTGLLIGMVAQAVMLRYLVHLGGGIARLPLFQVREASMAVHDEHSLAKVRGSVLS